MPHCSATDRRFMAAAIRLSRRHMGLTATNPSVGTLIVNDGIIVGRGVTAIGGRPHAEAQALAEAGTRARGATAYVTLEPCAHHGRTPPCADTLIAAGITRVVGAASDPDRRVSGKGYARLRAAGVEVEEGVLAAQSADLLAGYLTRSVRQRPEVILKLAVSQDGMIGKKGKGQVMISGAVSRAQAHRVRAEVDAILVGVGTALADDPELTCRLPGLETRSPLRIVVDPHLRLPPSSKLATTARQTPVLVAAAAAADETRRAALKAMGVGFVAVDLHQGRVALPELLEDLGAQGHMSLMVEGGAQTARHFIDEDLVDRLMLFCAAVTIGADGVASPVTPTSIPAGFRRVRQDRFGDDLYQEFVRQD